MAGLTNQGLEIRRLNDIRENLRSEANGIFNDLLVEDEILDTSSASTLGRLIGLITPSQTELWEALLEVYSAFDPNSASGVALDNLVALSGIVRKPATATTSRILLTGNFNITIPEGSLVSSSFTNNRFSIPTDIVLDGENAIGFVAQVQTVSEGVTYTITYDSGQNPVNLSYTSQVGDTDLDILQGLVNTVNENYGTVLTASLSGSTIEVTVNDLVSQASYSLSGNLYFSKITKGTTVVCTEVGPREQNSGTIDTISTPIFGWDSINQFAPAIPGSLRESDSQLRERFNETKFTRGSNIVESLYSDLISLDGVRTVQIYENLTNVVDSFGIPPHSFMVLIQGGLEEEIAEAIWRNRPAGIDTHGNSIYLIRDILGNLKEVKYQRPSFVDVYISVEVEVDGNFPADGAERLRSALFNYVNSEATVGKGVVYSRLYTPINSVPGHQVNSITLGLSPNPVGTSNIEVDYDQIIKLEIGNIEVTIV